MTGIATFWKPVVDVTDLDEGERFWSAVSGLSALGRHGGQYSVLDHHDASDGGAWILLQLVADRHDCTHGGTHLDFRVDDVTDAARRIEALGGTTQHPPSIHRPDGVDQLEWAVMRDPFGNPFCIIKWPLE